MTWSDPLGDFRAFLADGATDNLVKERKVLGNSQAGQNRTFYTFDDRITASGYQSACAAPLRVFWDASPGPGPVEIAASGILVTDAVRGEFQMMFVPSGLGKLTASYHYQQSRDAELNIFLQQGANQVSTDLPGNVPAGLQMPVLHIAGSLAYSRLAQRWQQRKSEQFMLQDEPARTEAEERIKFYQAESSRLLNAGMLLRRSYYDMRQDRGRAPAYGTLTRRPNPWTPDR